MDSLSALTASFVADVGVEIHSWRSRSAATASADALSMRSSVRRGGTGLLGLREDPGSLREALGLVDEPWTACRLFSESGSGGGKGIGA
jgi:hypothetical protein